MQSVKLAVVAASCVAIRSAAAQPMPPPPPPPPPAPAAPTAQSVLPDVMSTAVGAGIEARMDYTYIGDESDFTLLAFNLHGQYISPSGLGGYAALPFAFVSGGDDSETAIGNIELGGLYAFRQPDLDFYLRAGVAANTASDEGVFLLPFANTVPRLADAVTTGADTNWFRSGAGIRATSGALVIGGSGMFNVILDELDEDAFTVVTLTGSIGVQQPGFGLAAGVALYQILGEDGGGDDNTIGINLVGDVPVGPQARIFGTAGFNPENEDDAFSLGVGVRASM